MADLLRAVEAQLLCPTEEVEIAAEVEVAIVVMEATIVVTTRRAVMTTQKRIRMKIPNLITLGSVTGAELLIITQMTVHLVALATSVVSKVTKQLCASRS